MLNVNSNIARRQQRAEFRNHDGRSVRERLVRLYQKRACGDDPADRSVALAQLARLERRAELPSSRTVSRVVGQQQPRDGALADRIGAVVGPLRPRRNGDLEGRCPWHGSRSGTCLVIYARGTRWYCRSCGRGGDLAAWIAQYEGISIGKARRRLGLPVGRRRARRRPVLTVEVLP